METVTDKVLQELLDSKDQEEVLEEADSCCCENSQSSFKNFEKGFELHQIFLERKGPGVYLWKFSAYGGEDQVFFIGTKERVKERMVNIPDEPEYTGN